MRSRTSPISRKEKIATPAPTTARPLIPRKASSNRLATPSRNDAHARTFGLWDAVAGLDLTRLMSAPCPEFGACQRPRPSSPERVRQRARIEKGTFRNVPPANGRRAEHYEAGVDAPRQVVLAARLA